jgi:hypothetical protein
MEQPAALPEPVRSDVWIYRLIVGALALVAVVSIVGGLVLAALGVEIPAAIVGLGSAAIAGMVGLLAPSPSQ